MTAVDKRLPDLTIQKKDAATGEVVPNTVFEIQGVRTGYHKEVVTGNDGTVTLTGIPVDYYDVTEKNVPAPYVVSNEPTQTVWLGAGEHPTLVFSNLQEPKLSIMKIDAETSAPIAGVVFSVQPERTGNTRRRLRPEATVSPKLPSPRLTLSPRTMCGQSPSAPGRNSSSCLKT